jgi:hypothetical protein
LLAVQKHDWHLSYCCSSSQKNCMFCASVRTWPHAVVHLALPSFVQVLWKHPVDVHKKFPCHILDDFIADAIMTW